MGQFSWLDCKTEEQVLDNVRRDVYVLVPREFGGGHIKEECYDGTGRFGGHDIYDLVVDWNSKHLSAFFDNLDSWTCSVSEADIANMRRVSSGEETECEKRWLGIVLACYDDDNARLRYPIKITHDPDAVYERCGISKSDPNQGWPADDDEWDDGWDEEEW